MRKIIQVVLTRTGLSLLLLAWSVAAQTVTGNDKEVVANGGLLHSLFAAPVIGRPYSAEQVHSTVRVLADGTKISHQGHHFVARDAEGRVRVEVRLASGQDGQPDAVQVYVIDPVAHTLGTWLVGLQEAKNEATIFKIPAPNAQQPVKLASETSPKVDARPQPIVTVEDLGMDSLQGIAVSVQKTTTIVPAGRSGNDKPITKTHEVWASPDLKLVLKEEWNDPRTGTKTVELQNLSRSDPNPALFRPPPGYAVKNSNQGLKNLEEILVQNQN
jgi:hypothetical protein